MNEPTNVMRWCATFYLTAEPGTADAWYERALDTPFPIVASLVRYEPSAAQPELALTDPEGDE